MTELKLFAIASALAVSALVPAIAEAAKGWG